MRVTCDFDDITELDLIRAFYNLRYIAGNAWVRRSAFRGFHLKCHGLSISFEKSLELRRQFGDDSVRVILDEKRLKKTKQVLWTGKGGMEAGRWTEDVWEVVS